MRDRLEDGMDDAAEQMWSWCLVANVVDTHKTGQNHHVVHGTKIFSAGTKVYVSSEWSDTTPAGGSYKVIGRARKSHRLVCAWLRRDCMENLRLRRVFSPNVLRKMAEESGQSNGVNPSEFISWWGNGDADRDAIIRQFGLKDHNR